MSSVPLPELPSLSSAQSKPAAHTASSPQATENKEKFSSVLESEQATRDTQPPDSRQPLTASEPEDRLADNPAATEPMAEDGKPLPVPAEFAGLIVADASTEPGAAVVQDAGALKAQAVMAPVTGVVATASRVVTPSSTDVQERPGAILDYLLKRIDTVAIPGDKISRIATEPLNSVSAAVQQVIQTEVLPVQAAASVAGATDLNAMPVPAAQFNVVQALIDDPSNPLSNPQSLLAPVTTNAGPGSVSGSSTLPSTTLEVPFRQAGWDGALGERVVWMVNQKLQAAEIKLNPPQLGPIEVRINMQNDQAQVTFTAQHAHVREALEAAIPRLREMFGSSGLDLVEVGVSQQSFSQREHAESRPALGSTGLAADDGSRPGDDPSTVTDLSALPSSVIDLFA